MAVAQQPLVQLPQGKRTLELVEQRRGRLVFATPREEESWRRVSGVLQGANLVIAVIMAVGVVVSVLLAGAYTMATVFGVLIVAAFAANWFLADAAPFRTDEVVIDLNTRQVLLPKSNRLAGAYPLEEVEIRIISDAPPGDPGDANTHYWWLAMEFDLGCGLEGRYTAQVRFWGPAFYADAALAKREVERACEL